MAKEPVVMNVTVTVQPGATYVAYVEHLHLDSAPNTADKTALHPTSQVEGFLSAKALEPYIQAGLLTHDLMPSASLSHEQVAMLAHDIAVRFKMRKFWSFFKQKWGNSCNSSVYSRYAKSEDSVLFQKRLKNV